jgi:C4-dicarboxylate-specific signal transduction histidine kinase
MGTDPVTFDQLKRLAVTRPAEARAVVERLLDSQPSELASLFERMSSPGEGRLRQLVANAVRNRPQRGDAASCLQRWFDVETDEFTKRALRGALEALHVEPKTRKRGHAPVDPRIVEAFRFASKRITHRLRNALNAPQAALGRIQAAVEQLTDPIAREHISALAAHASAGFDLVARVAAFDVSDETFRFRPIVLADWIRTMNTEYARRYEAVEVAIEGPGQHAIVHANHHFLDTIFWNIWTNAQQAVEAVCRITVSIETDGNQVHATVRDNGDGIPDEVANVAFEQPFSTKASTGRGQGLLEIQDAVEELRGEVALVAGHSGRHWIRISLPLSR